LKLLIYYLGENVINLPKQKVAKNVTISLGFSKNHNEPSKVAPLAKNHPICFTLVKTFLLEVQILQSYLFIVSL
jgi:hypothetical protein